MDRMRSTDLPMAKYREPTEWIMQRTSLTLMWLLPTEIWSNNYIFSFSLFINLFKVLLWLVFFNSPEVQQQWGMICICTACSAAGISFHSWLVENASVTPCNYSEYSVSLCKRFKRHGRIQVMKRLSLI